VVKKEKVNFGIGQVVIYESFCENQLGSLNGLTDLGEKGYSI